MPLKVYPEPFEERVAELYRRIEFMASVNKVILVGNLGRDPETR
jgi:hypothetical protein